MTKEELIRFALQLRETERIRAMIAEEAVALANGQSDGIPIAAPPTKEEIVARGCDELYHLEGGAKREPHE